MRVDDTIRKTVVYVGDANGKSFVPHGTGFVAVSYIDGAAFQSIVTARHVIEGIEPDIHLRINTLDGEVKIIALRKSDFHQHSSGTVDLVACPTVIPVDRFAISHLDVEEPELMFEDYAPKNGADPEFGLGDEVIVVGMFQQRIGQSKNIPIIRSGTIAALPEEEIDTVHGRHSAYLIEVKSIDGLSGSPVFVTNSLFRTRAGQIEGQQTIKLKFLGTLLGHDEVMNRKDRIAIKADGSDIGEGVRTLLNTGIGIVAPAHLVRETVKHPTMEEGRRKALDRSRNKRS